MCVNDLVLCFKFLSKSLRLFGSNKFTFFKTLRHTKGIVILDYLQLDAGPEME